MDISNYHIQFQSEGTQNFLTVNLPMGSEIIPYLKKLLEKNKIPGLLTPNCQFLNGEARFKYSVNGKRVVKELAQSGMINDNKGFLILKNLTTALRTMNTYLIGLDKIVLNPEYLYVGDGMQVYMVCIPVEDGGNTDIPLQLKNFFLELLSNHLGNGSTKYSDMFMWVYKQTIFDLELFEKEFLDKKIEGDNANPGYGRSEEVYKKQNNFTPKPQSFAAGEASMGRAAEAKGNGSLNPQGNIPSGSAGGASSGSPIPIPGGGVMKTGDGKALNIPGVKGGGSSPAKENNAKKGFGINIFGKKKENQELNSSPSSNSEESIRPYIVHRGQKIDITKCPFSIGQGSKAYDVDYKIVNNFKVSHRHAIITEAEGVYYVQDNNSTNGTMINGFGLEPGVLQPLKDGDEIRLYDEIICFYLT